MKNNQKCVRLTDKTLEYIESFNGNGFNQKLEDMTDYFMAQEKRLKKRIADLEAKERNLIESIAALNSMEQSLKQIKQYLDAAKRFTADAPLPGQFKIS